MTSMDASPVCEPHALHGGPGCRGNAAFSGAYHDPFNDAALQRFPSTMPSNDPMNEALYRNGGVFHDALNDALDDNMMSPLGTPVPATGVPPPGMLLPGLALDSASPA